VDLHTLGSARWKHAGTVYLVAFANGRALSVGDLTLRVYDLETPKELATHSLSKTEDIRAAALSRDGRTVAAIGDGFLTVNDVATGKRRFGLTGKAAELSKVAFATNRRLLCGGKLGALRVLDATTGKSLFALDAPIPDSTLPICSLAVFPDGKRALVGDGAGGLSLYRLDRKAMLAPLAGHLEGEHVTAIAITPDGRFSVSADWGGRIVVFDHQAPATPRVRAILETDQVFQSIAISADGTRALAGSNEKVVLWSLARKRPIRELPRATAGYAVALDAEGKRAITGEARGAVRLIELAKGRQLSPHFGHASDVTCARALDDERLLTGGGDGKVRQWRVAARMEEWYLEAHDARILGLAVSADRTRMLTAADDRAARLWDLAAGRSIVGLDLDRCFGAACAISPDGTLGAIGSSGALTIWDLRTHLRLAKLADANRGTGIWACGFLPDGRLVVTDDDCTLRVHDVVRDKPGRTVKLKDHAMALAVTPDGRVLAGGQHPDVWLVDPSTGRVKALTGHRDWILSLAVSADGAWAASASLDHSVRLWRLGRGRQPRTPLAFAPAVDRPTCVAFFPDGRLAVGTARGCVIVFDRATYPA
jgi:WD40 repeat protein